MPDKSCKRTVTSATDLSVGVCQSAWQASGLKMGSEVDGDPVGDQKRDRDPECARPESEMLSWFHISEVLYWPPISRFDVHQASQANKMRTLWCIYKFHKDPLQRRMEMKTLQRTSGMHLYTGSGYAGSMTYEKPRRERNTAPYLKTKKDHKS